MNITALEVATVVAALFIVVEHLLRRVFNWNPPERYNYAIGVATVIGAVGITYGFVSNDWQPVLSSWLLYGPAFAICGILIFVLYGHAEHSEMQRKNDEMQHRYDEMQRQYDALQATIDALEASK